MKLKIVSALLIILVSSATAQDLKTTKALSYSEALSLMLNNNETLKQSAIKVEQKEEEAKSKRGLYLPKISLSANYVMMTDPLHLDLTPVRDAILPLYDANAALYYTLGNYGNFSGVPNPDPNTKGVMPILPDDISTSAVRNELLTGHDKILAGKKAVANAEWDKMIQEKYFGMVSANFTLPIYTGGKIRIANKAAKINIDEATAESRQKLGEVTMELVERYYGLLLAQKVEQVRTQVLNTMSIHLSEAEKMKNEGLISNTQFLQAKVYYTEAQREKSKAQKQVNIVNNALLNTLSIKEDTQIQVLSSFFYHNKIDKLEDYKTTAKSQSPLLQQITLKQALVEQKINLEKGNYLPTVAAMGTYHLADQDLSPYMPEGMVGVGLSWSLFEGNSRNRKLKAAKLQNEQVGLYYEKSKTNIETLITKYYNETQMYLDQIQQLDVSKQFAEEYYTACKKSFKEGLATSTEVSDASLLVAKIKIEQLQATYHYDVSLSKLLYYTGTPEKFNDYLSAGTTL